MSNASVKAMAEKRVRRQKIIIAVGSVALLAILGFELPKFLGGHGDSGVIEAVTTISPAAGTTPVVPVGTLPNTDRIVVARSSNQLISFGLFKSKDPFVQQLTTTAPTETTPPPSSETPPASTTPTTTSDGPAVVLVPVVPGGSSSTPPGSSTPGSSTTPSTSTTLPPVPTSALIATNGVCEQVSVKGTFPASENIFRLVSVAKDGKSVQVGIVGGSFDSGQPTATLKVGDKITLVNTADGTRYVIELKTKCSTIATPGTTTTSQPGSTTPVAPAPVTTDTTTTAPTTTATTPIVTDPLDTSTPTG
jgi:hypothetical protein